MKLLMTQNALDQTPGSVRLVRWSLYILLFAPLVFWPGFYYFLSSSKLFFILSLSQVILAGLMLSWLLYKGWLPRHSWILWSVCVYTFVVVVASIFGVNSLLSFWGSPVRTLNTIAFLHIVVVFFGMVSVLRSKRDWHRLFFVSTMVAVVESCIFFYTFFVRESASWYALTHGGSTLGNSSFLGTYLIFHIFLAGLLALSSDKRRAKWWMAIVTFFLAMTLFQTEAQAAILAFIGGAVFFLGLVLTFQKQRHQVIKRVLGILILVVLFIGATYVLGSLFIQQSPARQFLVERSSETRFILWEMAWEGFKDRPLLGWGPENFSGIFQTYYNPCLGSTACGGEIWFDRAHNKLFDLLAETGIFGFFAYLSIILAALWGIRRAVLSKRLNVPQASLLLALLATNLVQSLTVFDTLISYLSWFAVLGYIHTLSGSPEERAIVRSLNSNPRMRQRVSWLIIPAVFVLFYFVTFLPARSSIETKAVFDATTYPEHVAHYKIASTVSPYGVDLRRSALAAQTATIILDLAPDDQTKFSSFLLEELSLAEQGLLDSINHSPDFLRGYLDLVFIYDVWGRSFDSKKNIAAFEMSQQAIERFPRNPLPYWSQVSLLLEKDDTKQALVVAEKALSLGPDVLNSLMRSLITVKFLEDPEAELKVARDIIALEPTLGPLVEAYLSADVETRRVDLLFRFYYDAAF